VGEVRRQILEKLKIGNTEKLKAEIPPELDFVSHF
jgi:hypothetical protein